MKATEDDELADESTCRNLKESSFRAKQTRPDILFAVNVLSKFMAKPTKAISTCIIEPENSVLQTKYHYFVGRK